MNERTKAHMVGNELAVRNLIALLRDGEKGFSDLSEAIHNRGCREFFLEESRVRGVFAGELERMLSSVTGDTVHETGTALGTMHRVYIDLKTKLGAGDHALLETVQHCEQVASTAYEEVLRDREIPHVVHALVSVQSKHVDRTHDLVRQYLDVLES